MTQTAKTPWRFSPWHIEEGPSAVYDANGDLVCTTSSDETAKMIAAAPDMLESLRRVVDTCRAGCPAGLPALSAARAAIARATGEAKP